MKKFGIRTDGTEEAIEKLICFHSRMFQEYTYLEIGTAEGVTLKAITDILKEENHPKWRTIGIDIPDGWSLNMQTIYSQFGKELFFQDVSRGQVPILAPWNDPSLILIDGKKPLEFKEPIQFAFIDGCHGAPCVMKDFLSIENNIVKGGIVMFHDAGKIEQGTDWQGHCGEHINVRKAISNLGLWGEQEEKTGDRYGWYFMGMIEGDRKNGGWGNSAAVFQKN